jgi:dihydropteroate synthase
MDQHQPTLVMGILNVTPDSFADGGRHFTLEAAIARSRVMVDEGVDIIDVGGESTRPGSSRISLEEERDRVIPVISEIASLGVTISIDTTRSEIAALAIAKGATIVNDISGGLQDPAIPKLLAAHPQVQYIAMHWRGESKDMQSRAIYKDVVGEVREELDERAAALIDAGVLPEQIILDPGIGFAKTGEHNWELLRNIDRIQLLGYPVMIGVSRKRFLGDLVGASDPDHRDAATLAITTEMARKGVWAVRTHSVKPHVDAIKVVEELAR